MDPTASLNETAETLWVLDWSEAQAGWNWAAQDGDGKWYWYRTRPILGLAGQIWRANSRNQRFAGQGAPNPDWDLSLQHRPA
ncbi:MAG TPA: hypothetical protein PKA16_02515 [Ottowia sp.]|uniref:hypothetical protein n=1 Tax=Ottowia sp. TaxID=1898956 RepID=UPI002BB60633|nr:hypothetical protein [Ottowia sp.]HMN20245.1 hypothetical protein [Ottowia sp.]